MPRIGKLLLPVVAAVALAAAVQPAEAKTNDNKIDVTVIVHCCLGNVFWEPLLHGAKEAAKLFDVNLDIQNTEGDPAKQVNLIEQAIANKHCARSMPRSPV